MVSLGWTDFISFLNLISWVASISSEKVKKGIESDSVIVFVIAFLIPVICFTLKLYSIEKLTDHPQRFQWGAQFCICECVLIQTLHRMNQSSELKERLFLVFRCWCSLLCQFWWHGRFFLSMEHRWYWCPPSWLCSAQQGSKVTYLNHDREQQCSSHFICL